MRHGLFNVEDRTRLARAIVQERGDRNKADDDSHPARAAQVDLRRNAVEARQECEKALTIYTKVQKLISITAHERKVLARFTDGTLERRRKQAENAYGHGKCFDLEQRRSDYHESLHGRTPEHVFPQVAQTWPDLHDHIGAELI